jgi:hypothetical protein
MIKTHAASSANPLTHTPIHTNTDWVAVPPNNILVVTPDLHLLLAPIGASAAMSLALENIMSMERLLPQEVRGGRKQQPAMDGWMDGWMDECKV